MEKIHKKRNRIPYFSKTLVTKNLKIMIILVFFIEQILIWMILIRIWYKHTKETASEIFKIWLKKNIFKNKFKTRSNVNKWMSHPFIMMKPIMTLKKIKNRVFLTNPILEIYHWDCHLTKDIKSYWVLLHQEKMNRLKILMNLFLKLFKFIN